jgi:hypothetical protein
LKLLVQSRNLTRNGFISYNSAFNTNLSSLLHNPASETDLVVHAEKQVEATLDDLIATGALQMKN